jgi:tryptophan 2,3-dioxygenase
MDREHFYSMINGKGEKDYEVYLNTKTLLSCQKDFDQLCNADELQFQVVHQSMELWMKLIAYSLLDIDDYMPQRNTNRILTLFGRVHKILRLMMDHFPILETMSPKEYQEIRLQLGNGSGQESPGFNTLLRMYRPLWESFVQYYVAADGLTIEQIYNSKYTHSDAYMVAEAMIEYDALFQQFRFHHIHLIHRSIGLSARSLKGRPVELLQEGVRLQFFPELWSIRGDMTDLWGHEYGVVRDSISHGH